LLGWSSQRNFLPASEDSSRLKPSGTTTASTALGEPHVTVLPRVGKVGGLNRLLILKFSFLALRARTHQGGCVGPFPMGMLGGLTWAILLLKNSEDRRGRRALTHSGQEGSAA